LRHPSFGNYEAARVANAYFSGGLFGPAVSPFEHGDHAFWLLSSASSWLPDRIHSFLIEGMMNWNVWTWGYIGTEKGGDWKSNGSLARALCEAVNRKPFKWSRPIKDDVLHRIELAIEILKLPDSPGQILKLFIDYDFAGNWIRAENRRRRMRAGRTGKGAKSKKK